ncbi:MAG: hypothetical protein PWR29_1760 [Methanolobus sp.]|jgi:hypothetical protein|nr:hypothetical protein [Methanolobus sp.]MDK2912803.1 hypothetical protein [Methanolobus sp.]
MVKGRDVNKPECTASECQVSVGGCESDYRNESEGFHSVCRQAFIRVPSDKRSNMRSL